MMIENGKQRIFLYVVCGCLVILFTQLVLFQGPVVLVTPIVSFNSLMKRGIYGNSRTTTQLYIKTSTTPGPVCSETSLWGEHDSLKPVVSNTKVWSFSQGVKCHDLNISEIQLNVNRIKIHLNCTGSGETIHLHQTLTNDTEDIQTVQFRDRCVNAYIQNCCQSNYRVPNVVHYVWYNRGKLDFVTFLSLLSVIRFVKPCLIIFHGNRIPSGHYWNFIIHVSPNIIHMKRESPTTIYGQKVKHKEHSSDIMRIEALIEYGGIYLDTDTVLVRSINPLRKYACVMSKQSSGLMGSAFIMSEKNSTFVRLWKDGYRYHFEREKYTYNAMIYPGKLAKKYPDLIRVEYTTVSRPDKMIGGKVYNSSFATYNWSSIYGIHLYSRIYKKPFNEVSIRKMNFTVGSISRHVVYGNKEICED